MPIHPVFDSLSDEDQRKARERADKRGWSLEMGAISVKAGDDSISGIEASLMARHEKKDANAEKQTAIQQLKKRYNEAKAAGRSLEMVSAKNELFNRYDIRV
jgi:hypothetical protein